jgi:LMBR1 domain-containing protein 1
MVDPWLIVVTVVLTVALLVATFWLVIHYLDETEKGFGDSWLCKIMVVKSMQMFGFMLCWAQVLALPLDAANARGAGGGLDMEVLWEVIYMMVFAMVCFLLPVTMFYYESDEDTSMGERLCYTFKHMIFVLIVVGLILGIFFGLLAWTNIPVETYSCDVSGFVSSNAPNPTSNCSDGSVDLVIPVTFPIYVMGLLSFVGWWLFVAFGGIGLTAIPLDLINKFRFRPVAVSSKQLTHEQLELKKRSLRSKTEELLELTATVRAKKLQSEAETGWWRKRKVHNELRRDLNKLQAHTLYLEQDYELYGKSLTVRKHAAVWAVVYPLILVAGLFLAIISILWLLHIIIYIAVKHDKGKPANPFLNSVLIGLDHPASRWFGTAVYAGLAIFLMWASIKGCIKFGLRFFCCCRAHPMEPNRTPMNSMIFNVMLLLLCSVAVTLFCSNSLSMYTRLTAINEIFGVQVRYLVFFRYFYENNVFEYMLLAWSILTGFYLCLRGRAPPKGMEDMVSSRQKYDLQLEKEKANIQRKNFI